jgi:hypothetical protein
MGDFFYVWVTINFLSFVNTVFWGKDGSGTALRAGLGFL